MSANIDTMLYVGQKPWHGLGASYDTVPTTSKEIIAGAKLDWTVAAAPMMTDIHGEIMNYKAIYREDNSEVLGVVRSYHPRIVQNSDTFIAFERMLGDSLSFDTAASLGAGERVFGCFKINEQYKVMDDDIDHYFVVLNEHLRPDGKVTVLNTPIRVVCQNSLNAALSNNAYKLRIPVTSDTGINIELMNTLLDSSTRAKEQLTAKSEKMYKVKINRDNVSDLLDELFPYVSGPEDMGHEKQNERIDMIRDTFLECMNKDDLGNFRGTALQMFQAAVDFEQHYFKNFEKGYDLSYRMNTLPGIGTGEQTAISTKTNKMIQKLMA